MGISDVVHASVIEGDWDGIIRAVRIALLQAFTEGFAKGRKDTVEKDLAHSVTDAWFESRTRQEHGDLETEEATDEHE